MKPKQDWKDRMRNWLRRRVTPPDGVGEQSVDPMPFARFDGPVGLGEFLAGAPALAADRDEDARLWRLRWLAEDLPLERNLAPELEAAVREFRPGGRHPDFDPLGALEPAQLLFFDTETLGLGNAGVFLIGCMAVRCGRFALEQLLAEDYSEEPGILRAFARALGNSRCLVSFNGKAYDLPLLSCRSGMWKVDLSRAEALPHLDLLYECRRRWSQELPNCRLTTLEAALCGRPRRGDLPGRDVPAVYHEFVERRDARLLAPVLQHNVLDLLAMARILLRCLSVG